MFPYPFPTNFVILRRPVNNKLPEERRESVQTLYARTTKEFLDFRGGVVEEKADNLNINEGDCVSSEAEETVKRLAYNTT